MRSKYGNKKTIVDGIKFDSLLEKEYYSYLVTQKQVGLIKDFELQPSFILQESFKHNKKAIRPIVYKADFKITNPEGDTYLVDTKGFRDKVFLLKLKMFKYKYPDEKLYLAKYTKKEGWTHEC